MYEKLLQLPQVNFKGLNNNQIKRSIMKKDDRSFVVIYELLASNMGVDSSAPMNLSNLKKEELIFNPHIDQIAGQSFNRCLLNDS